jgi:hypothetical protein
MKRVSIWGCWLVTVGLLLVAGAGWAQKSAPAKAKRAPNPAMLAVEEVAGLPRVLLIGDSISIGYTIPVREKLKGKANVLRPLTNCGPSSRGVEGLEDWLGEGTWDVIHFNFGLHDLVYMGPDGSRLVDPKLAGARHQVPLAEYEANLRQMVARLKQTGAKLIWCSTTPVPEGSAGRVADESVLFNEVAAKVMEELGVGIHDLHAHALPVLKTIQLPANVHFTAEGSDFLADRVVEAITKALAD